MKHQNYYDRALKADDRRYARVFEKMGYGTRDMRAINDGEMSVNEVRENRGMVPVLDEISELRAEYERVIGRRPFMGWDAGKLREKIAEARSDE